MRVILAYKNFAANKNISHIGLGVAALNTCKTLIHNGIACEVWPIVSSNELRQRINLDIAANHQPPLTHVVISAPWIATNDINSLCMLFPRIRFAVNCHSNVGFLQADPKGMQLVREGLGLEMAVPNFSVAANALRMCQWVTDCYDAPCTYLPNLYYIDEIPRQHKPVWRGGVLRLGCFGATRPQKNIVSAVGAAMELCKQLKAETEIWVSSQRTEGGGDVIMRTVRQMTQNVPNLTLKEAGWLSWPQFRTLVGTMHLLLQPSYTESFNMVTADGIVEGVPSVVSDAIDWVPPYWRAHADEVMDIARVGHHLLHDPRAASQGLYNLRVYIHLGLQAWRKFLAYPRIQ